MRIYKDILEHMFKEKLNDMFWDLEVDDLRDAFQSACCDALHEIKSIVENPYLSDFECIDKIVCVLESVGSDGGGRHDF